MADKEKNILENPYEVEITSSDSAIQAYLDAKNASRNTRDNWDIVSDVSSDVLGAVNIYQEEKQAEEERRKLELEGYEEEFYANVEKITANAGGLGEEAYGLATEQAKLLQEKYMQAVQSGDKEMQSKLKMELQGLSTSVQGLKEGLSLAADLKNGDLLSNGRTAEEKEIAAVCTNPANLVYDEGEWKFKNPKYDGSPGSKQFFTTEDLSNSLGQKETDLSVKYIDWEETMSTSGSDLVNGVEGAAEFDFGRVKTSIGDQFITQDNIMSVMHDDFRKAGESHTFAADLGGYLKSMGDDLYKELRIDANGDGVFTPDDWDSEEDKKKIIDAITNKDSKVMGRDGKMIKLYNFNTSKNIVADYLTRQAENKFYGDSKKYGKTLQERKALRPEGGETKKQFIARGGIMGELGGDNIIWDEETQTFNQKSISSTQDLLKTV